MLRPFRFLIPAIFIVALGCAESDPGTDPPASPAGSAQPADPADPGDPADPVTPAGIPSDTLPPDEKAFQAAFTKTLAEAETMDFAALMAAYPPPATPSAALGYDPTAAAYYAEIRAKLQLTAAEEAALADRGFMVSDRLHFRTPAWAYDTVFRNDLPVLITTDSVLHALHRSFDEILKALEVTVISPRLTDLLAGVHAALPNLPATGDLADPVLDLDIYLAVARSLLAGAPVATLFGNDAVVGAFLAAVAEQRMTDMEIFGVQRKIDFTQFEPRGHYTDSEALERYFRAMMWLGRIDFRLREFDPMTGEPLWRDRQIRAAWALDAAVEAAGGFGAWKMMTDLIGALMGDVDSMDLTGWRSFAAEAKLAGPSDLQGDLSALHDLLAAGRYGTQKINSHYLSTNPFSAEVTPLPLSFTVMGQRFVVDSYVFANVVYDHIVHDGAKVYRRLPKALDALFVLGQNAALPLLEGELAQWHYAPNLHTLRFLVDAYDDGFWQNSVYNLWLSAIRGLNTLPEGAVPAPMKTEAWTHKTLSSQLASWAELRHDTILYAKQSYTGGAACEYPDGYVEPYPALYAALGAAGARLQAVLVGVPLDANTQDLLGTWVQSWTQAMTHLESMAQKELAETPFNAEELAFLASWIQQPAEAMCGGPSFTGWYPTLFFNPMHAEEYDPTIADVHTNPNEDGPLAPAAVLHVGTGEARMMVLTRATCEGVRAYAGPVSTYYEVEEPGMDRLTDEEWRERLYGPTPPAPPAWTASFSVPAP